MLTKFCCSFTAGGIWPTLFSCLEGSSHHVRRHVLNDINGLLVSPNGGPHNSESILSMPEWSHFIMPVLGDIPHQTDDSKDYMQ